MNKYAQDIFYDNDGVPTIKSDSQSARAFLTRVFTIMAFGLGITGLVSWLFFSKWLSVESNAISYFAGPLPWVVMFAPLGFILVMNFGLRRMSYLVTTLVFIGFAVIMGLSLSTIFFAYSLGTIFNVFLITTSIFGAMALLGATTKMDLTKLGTILGVALFGIIIAMVVNWFLQSSGLDYIISIIGVVVFSGLTAYETQKLLRLGAVIGTEGEAAGKMSVMGALSLYLSFINLFLFLLRIFGGDD